MKTKVYKNGLVLLYQKNNTSQADSFHVNVLTGSALETKKQTGINHLVEHLMFKSSFKRTTEEISEELESLGALINAWTNFENVCFYFDCCSENLESCAEIYADMLFNKDITQKEFEKEKSVVCQEIAMYKDLYEATNEENYFSYFWGMSPIAGTVESVESMTLKQINTFIKRRYVPANMVLSVFSSLSFKKICKIVNKHFGKVNNPNEYLDLRKEWNKKQIFKKENEGNIHSVKNKAAQVQVLHAFKLPKQSSTACQFCADLLSFGMNSILFREIREKMGLCYSINAEVVTLVQPVFNTNQNDVILIKSSMEKKHLNTYLKTLPNILNNLSCFIEDSDKDRVINLQKTIGIKNHTYCYDMLFRYLNPNVKFYKKDIKAEKKYIIKNFERLVTNPSELFGEFTYEVSILGNVAIKK